MGGTFADRAWTELQKAHAALQNVHFADGMREKLCAAILAGGGDPDELPSALAGKLRDFENLPQEQYTACRAVQQPLIGLAVESSRQAVFRKEMDEVLRTLCTYSGSLAG